MDMLPAAPLIEAVQLRYGGLPSFATRGTLARAWYRGRALGEFSVWQVDTLSVRLLNQHPALIYGIAWWPASDAEPCGSADIS